MILRLTLAALSLAANSNPASARQQSGSERRLAARRWQCTRAHSTVRQQHLLRPMSGSRTQVAAKRSATSW